MSEIKLQSDIVRKFSELYPEKRGQLFHVPNERNHALQAIQAKGIGIFPGVSDLIYVSENGLKCLELKYPGRSHEVWHVKQQLEWGKTMESLGNDWKLITDIDDAINFINGKDNGGLSIQEVEQKIKDNGTKKRIKF